MKIKLLKKIIIGIGSVSMGAAIVLSAPGLVSSSQNKTYTSKNSINDYFVDFNPVTFDRENDKLFIENILQDKYGNFWVATRLGLWRSTDGNTFNWFNFGIEGINELSIFNINSLFQDKDENIWAGTTEGLWKSNDGNTFNHVLENEVEWVLDDIFQDKDGNIWVVSNDNQLWKSTDGNTFNKVLDKTSESIFDINGIFQDKDGSIWFWTTMYGLWKSTDGNTFNQVTYEIEGSSAFNINSLFQDKDGNIWMLVGGSVEPNGLWKSTDGNEFTQITNEVVSEVFQDKDGSIWIGISEKGLWKSTDGNTFNQVTLKEGTSQWSIYSIFQDKDGSMWIGTQSDGLWKSIDGNTFNQVTLKEGTSQWGIYSIFQDKDDNIWVGIGKHELWKSVSVAFPTFTPESTHNTIKEEDQTIYISDQSITLNIHPADLIIIDGEIIRKTNEVTQYTFDSTGSPHTITISISGHNYIIFVYIVESPVIENGLNYSYYNSASDKLSIYMDQAIVESILLDYDGRPQNMDLLSFVDNTGKWNDLFSNKTIMENLVGNLDLDYEEGFEYIVGIDELLTQSPNFTSKYYTQAFLKKIHAINPTNGIEFKIELGKIDEGFSIKNFGSPWINTDVEPDNPEYMTTKYWDNILFNQDSNKISEDWS